MSAPDIKNLIGVRYGYNGGVQVAEKVGWPSPGRVIVRKYRANSGRWTKPRAISESDVRPLNAVPPGVVRAALETVQ